jgi:hypothetical protein
MKSFVNIVGYQQMTCHFIFKQKIYIYISVLIRFSLCVRDFLAGQKENKLIGR